jgi:hypothetical protein
MSPAYETFYIKRILISKFEVWTRNSFGNVYLPHRIEIKEKYLLVIFLIKAHYFNVTNVKKSIVFYVSGSSAMDAYPSLEERT